MLPGNCHQVEAVGLLSTAIVTPIGPYQDMDQLENRAWDQNNPWQQSGSRRANLIYQCSHHLGERTP
ncbi:MAG: hypothetical protein C5B47_08505 [Verrucomicrobia bacterium]|nr:MAG: hypothetical protein C5B47_08505 [Verrucomicrobiota bacterium]